MRIAYVSTIRGAPWGGSEELWLQSATAVMAAGHDVGVFVYKWPDEPLPLRQLREKNAALFSRRRSPSLSMRILRKIAGRVGLGHALFFNPYKELPAFRPDCIVITDGATWYAADDQELRNLLVERFPGKYIVISQGNGPYHFPADRAAAISFFRTAKKIVFVAENNRLQAFHQLGQRLENTLVIQNPVNLPFYEQLDLPESKDGYVDLALVGRLTVGDKGQDIVISMMAEKEWLTRKIRIHIYGKGQDLDYIRSLIAFYQVEEKVIIEGQAPIEDIWRKCQALLMPSIIEGTPLTLLEAMVLGRVCIVTRVGGNDEWVVDGRNGFLAEAPTQELLSNKLREAMDNLDKWPDIAGRAHRDAMAKLDRNPGKTLMAQIIS
jgi:glycosyltransferase involved in cell wall biosynthesis